VRKTKKKKSEEEEEEECVEQPVVLICATFQTISVPQVERRLTCS